MQRCLRDLTFSDFGTVPACNRRMEGLMDTQTHDDSICCSNIASCGKN